MSAPDLTPAIMAQFAASGADKHLTLLLGAGASVASGLPDWNELAVRLLLRSGAVRDRRLAELLVREQDPLLVAEAAKQSLDSEWEASVRQALYEGSRAAVPSSLHLAVARHFVNEPPGKTTLITLNFDTLLEQAVGLLSARRVGSLASSSDGEDEPRVHHLHGVAGASSAKNLVLALSDYNEALSAGLPWQEVLLIRSLRRGALLLVGTSYRDPDVRKWFHHVLRDHPRNHAAVVLLVRETFRLNQKNFEGVRQALIGQWKAVGLEPVIATDYSDVVQIIRELAHIHRPGYLSPQERTRLIWREHSAHFTTYQAAYARRLEAESCELSQTANMSGVRTSLWLADGRGSLARWAVSDRTYRSTTVLRYVPTGHDSSVLAGRALSAEEPQWDETNARLENRWGCSLAIPIRTRIRSLPTAATAVYVIDLPGTVDQLRAEFDVNSPAVRGVENGWAERLSHAVTASPT